MPHRMGSKHREFIITTPEGDICGLARIVQSRDGNMEYHWIPAGDEDSATRVAISATMQARQLLAAWLDMRGDDRLRLAG